MTNQKLSNVRTLSEATARLKQARETLKAAISHLPMDADEVAHNMQAVVIRMDTIARKMR